MDSRVVPCVLAAIAVACGSSSHDPPGPENPDVPVIPGDGAEEFVSHVAGQSTSRAGVPGDANFSGAGGATASPAPTAGQDAARAIAEADIIQVDGNRLYALSRYAGMTVVDLSNPRDLRVLGNHRGAAEPFEMYLQGSTAYVMLNGYWTREFDEALGHSVWQNTARMQALDVSDPANIRVLGDIAVPGTISDSRMVGDIVYLATYQDSYCYRCDSVENTRITSFDASDPTAFRQIDEVRFDSQMGSWGPRSISVTTERMYVGGPNWSDAGRGTIQVVNIADPAGDLSLGAEISIAGSIQNRWQMDEHSGVLRVISQPGGWGSLVPPEVETFQVASATSVTPLGRLTMVLPRPEALQSVRFDGTRGYAVTFEQTDPLFTLDLSEPATPRQLGELEIPGWLYHMEPRGDRLYALGFDDATEGRGLTVSIFDVSNMTAPTMVDRVIFGGTWASVAEDQDRIHKAFNLALDQGLILVPFSGSQSDPTGCSYSWQSGIQLIDVAGDDLLLRGVAPQVGEARRALLHEGALFGVSDNAVQAFDIANRDAPAALDSLEVARNIESVHVMGDHLLRFGQDWYTGRTLLDFTSTSDASTAEPVGELDLSALFAQEENLCTESSYWSSQVYVHGDVAYVPRHHYRWDGTGQTNTQSMTIYVVSLANRAAPQIAGSFEVDAATSVQLPNGYDSESIGDILLTDSALLVGRSEVSYQYDTTGVTGTTEQAARYFYDVYSLESPLAPRFTTRFEVPEAIAAYGWGYGPMGCGLDMRWGWWFPGSGTSALVSGDIVASNHSVPLDDGTDRVRYYLDRFDVSNPDNPRLLPEVNIPGQVTYFDAARGFLLTVEDGFESIDASSWEDCTWRSSRAYFDEQGVCHLYDRLLNALVLNENVARRVSQVNLDGDFISTSLAFSADRVFVARSEAGPYPYNTPNPEPRAREIVPFLIAENGQLGSIPAVSFGSDDGYGWPSLVARGSRAFLTDSYEMTVVDTENPTAPTLVTHEMPGYYCTSLQVSGDTAYCAMNQYGVTTFGL